VLISARSVTTIVFVVALLASDKAAESSSPLARVTYRDCSDELDSLAKATDEAARLSRKATGIQTEVDQRRRQEQLVCAPPVSSDEDCRSARSELRRAESELADVERGFRSAFRRVEGRFSAVQFSCSSVGTLPPIAGVRPANVEACTMLRSFREPPSGLVMQLNGNCRQLGLSEDECRICLMENYREPLKKP
jgi:hypothetical protein